MSLRKEFNLIEQELESLSEQQLDEMRADIHRTSSLDEWMKKHPIVKRIIILVIRVVALLPFTGPITDIALTGAVEILEREK